MVPFTEMAVGAERLCAAGWPVQTLAVDTDHAGVIGATYAPEVSRCVPDHPISSVGLAVARAVAAVP